MAHTYFVIKRSGHPDRLLVWDTRTLSIGRAKENDLVVAENEISRRHAIFKKEGNRLGVGDYQTGNGTFVNGERIGTELHPLKSGDVIAIATLLTFELHDGDVHPAKRGLKLEYASHLKTVGMMPAGANPNATMLGMADTLPAEDEDFVIERRSWDDKNGPPALLDDILIQKKADESPDFNIDDPDVETPPPAKTGPLAKTAPPAPRPAAVKPAPKAGAPPAAPKAAAQAAEDPGETQDGDPIARLRRLKGLHAEGLITDEEFERKRAKILEEI